MKVSVVLIHIGYNLMLYDRKPYVKKAVFGGDNWGVAGSGAVNNCGDVGKRAKVFTDICGKVVSNVCSRLAGREGKNVLASL